MSFVVPQIADFQAQFALDFPYGKGTDAVSPDEIQNALNLVASGAYFNAALFSLAPLGAAGATPTTNEATLAFLYCAAHFVWKRVKARGGLRAPGAKGGTYSTGLGVSESASVGPVSTGTGWPDSVKNDPMLFQFTQSPYGEFYLQMLTPKLVGNIGLVGGERLPVGWGY
ncbi:MAG: hypothetical protein PHS14_00265 [Elusimicrobia bacterium]|nr:hypothetical protein [Elusimicrobiota bacterium]